MTGNLTEALSSDRRAIVPASMEKASARTGYAPALAVAGFVFCAGQIGRRPDGQIPQDPAAQFEAAWSNLELVLREADCRFDDVVDLVTYHVGLSKHFETFKQVKRRFFPAGTCPWTVIGVSELVSPEMLVEIKAIARPSTG